MNAALNYKPTATPTASHTFRSIGSQKNMAPQLEKGDSLKAATKQPVRSSTKNTATPLVEINGLKNGLQPVSRSFALTPPQPLLPIPSLCMAPDTQKRKRDPALETNRQSPKKPAKRRMYPPGVKGPRNAFTIFQKEYYASVRKEYPDIHTNEVSQKVAAIWKEVDENTKKEYSDKASIDKERFENDMAAAARFSKSSNHKPVGRPRTKPATPSNISASHPHPPPSILPASSQAASPNYSVIILPVKNELPAPEYDAYGQIGTQRQQAQPLLSGRNM